MALVLSTVILSFYGYGFAYVDAVVQALHALTDKDKAIVCTVLFETHSYPWQSFICLLHVIVAKTELLQVLDQRQCKEYVVVDDQDVCTCIFLPLLRLGHVKDDLNAQSQCLVTGDLACLNGRHTV